LLKDEQVLPTCFYWAKRLRCKDASFDELVNEGFVVAKKLRSPLLLQKWVKWTMIHFINKQKSLYCDVGSLTVEQEANVADRSFDFREFAEFQEDLLDVVSAACSEKEQKLLYMLYWSNLTYRQIAKLQGVKFQTIFFRVQKILKKLRKEYGKRTH